MMQTDVLIIGGGLSGLAVADQMARAGRSFVLAEARSRLGGRILSEQIGAAQYDLGPAWFWPGQPRIAALVARFGLTRFDQHAEGILSYEDEAGRMHRGQGFASMQGSWRLDGGLQQLIEALAGGLPADSVKTGLQIDALRDEGARVVATASDGQEIAARQVVLALPPRVARQIRFAPDLPEAADRALAGIPTWMAGQAKAVAVYDQPFWREEGLSGDAMSRYGPMVEIHGASPMDGSGGALFGFIGVPPAARADEDALRAAILDQLGRLFGDRARSPEALLVKDWAQDPLTATALDQTPLAAHPTYGLPPVLDALWGDRLIWAGTEVAPGFGGYLEGALEAAENAVARLTETAAEVGHGV